MVLPCHRAEEIGKGNVDARFGFFIPEDFQDQTRIPLATFIVGDVPVGHFAGTAQVCQHHFVPLGYDKLVVLDMRARNAPCDPVQVLHILGDSRTGRHGAKSERERPR